MHATPVVRCNRRPRPPTSWPATATHLRWQWLVARLTLSTHRDRSWMQGWMPEGSTACPRCAASAASAGTPSAAALPGAQARGWRMMAMGQAMTTFSPCPSLRSLPRALHSCARWGQVVGWAPSPHVCTLPAMPCHALASRCACHQGVLCCVIVGALEHASVAALQLLVSSPMPSVMFPCQLFDNKPRWTHAGMLL